MGYCSIHGWFYEPICPKCIRGYSRGKLDSSFELWVVDKFVFDDPPLLNKRNESENDCYCGCPGCGKSHSHLSSVKIANKEGLLDLLTSTLDTLLMFEASIQRDESLLKNENIRDYIRGRTQNVINIAEIFNDNELIKDKKEIYISLCMDCFELRNVLNLPNPNKSLVLRLVRDIQNSCINYFDINIYN